MGTTYILRHLKRAHASQPATDYLHGAILVNAAASTPLCISPGAKANCSRRLRLINHSRGPTSDSGWNAGLLLIVINNRSCRRNDRRVAASFLPHWPATSLPYLFR